MEGGAVDAYRNKVGSTMTAGGQEVSIVAPHLETRIGKKIWLERRSRGNGGGGGGGDGRTLKRLAASH